MRLNFDTLCFDQRQVNPGKLAFACSDGDITWLQFEEQVNRLLSIFKQINLPKGHPVLIYGHKETLFPIAITACFIYGVPYVPVDIIMPTERLAKILSISGSSLVVNCTYKTIDVAGSAIIANDYTVHNVDKVSFKTIVHTHKPLAYIMFTSGSTGEPKGVMISMEGVRSFINWFKCDFPANEGSVFMNQAPFSFDISLVEMLGTLSLGATAVLNDYDIVKNENKFVERLKQYGCTFWNSTPSFAYLYLTSSSFTADNLSSINTFLFMGEELKSRLVQRLGKNFPGVKVYNAYGPTEATIVTTLIEITPEILSNYESSLPIGYPKPDGKIIIENTSGNEQEEGEIIITGDHVAMGYLNRNDLTEEKFYRKDGKRAYKTGDFGYKKDNIVFYNGRKDEQVKLNGYRIEIGEITRHLENIDFISEAITIPLKAGGQVKKIVAFVRLKAAHGRNKEELKTEISHILNSKMPFYMVPSDIVFVDAFPVNSNHKIDKNQLIDIYTG